MLEENGMHKEFELMKYHISLLMQLKDEYQKELFKLTGKDLYKPYRKKPEKENEFGGRAVFELISELLQNKLTVN